MGDKSKEELLKEKELNRSLVALSKATQQELGVCAIQKADNVFFLGNRKYIKIYSLKSALNDSDRKKAFLEEMEKITSNRFRISVFCKNTDSKSNFYMFITVYFEADDYVRARGEIEKFEKEFKEHVVRQLSLNVTECKIKDILAIVYMNSSGKIKRFDDFETNLAKANWKEILLHELKNIHYGNFQCDESYGACYIAKEFPNNAIAVNDAYAKCKGNIYYCVDIQTFTEEEKQILEYEIKNKYNSRADFINKNVMNMTYLISLSAPTENMLHDLKLQVEKEFERAGVLLLPCSGREEVIFDSLCSLGICDFHSMQNVGPDVVSSLLF